MHKSFRRIFSALLSAVMLLPLLVTAPINTVSAAPSAIAADLSSLTEASKLLHIYQNEYIPEGTAHTYGEKVGLYTFDEAEGALSLLRSPLDYMGGYYRFHVRLKGVPVSDQVWMVVSYKTNADEKAGMYFTANTNSTARVTLAEDVSVSRGEYVRTAPVNINASGVTALFSRIRENNHNALCVNLSKDTPDDVYFYINEICFFNSSAAADSYVKTGTLPEDTNKFSSEHVPGQYIEGMYTDENGTIGICVYLPKDFSSEKEYPLLISFHAQGGGVSKTTHKNAQKLFGDEFIFFAPLCPTGQLWTKPKLKNGTYVYDYDNPAKAMATTVSYIENVLFETYNIDRSRIYATGHSLGGGGTWEFITRAPELVTAALPVAGYCDPSQAINIDDDVTVWLVHSKQDKSISVTAAHAMAASLMNLDKANFRYTEYDLTDPEQKALFENSWERSTNWEHWAWVPAFKNEEMLTYILTAKKPASEAKISRFTDVRVTDSYFKAVNYVADAGLFKGITETTFEPDTHMTRAMFVTVLGRLSGIDPAQYTAVSFTDVEVGSWYAPYVEWAASTGIVSGIGSGLYGVNDVITVEQACTILARYADNSAAPHDTLLDFVHYSDGEEVSDWARNGVKWAMSNSIYMGRGMELNARNSASRAVIATMFYSYSKIFADR